MNRPLRDHRILAIVATLPILALAAGLVAPRVALAHGHGGGQVVTSGPVVGFSAPATAFYGGFAQTGDVTQAAYYQAQPTPPAPAAAPAQPAAVPTQPVQATAPAQPVVNGAMGGWGGDWYLAPSPCGYTSPDAILGVQGANIHRWVPIRFYRP